MRIILGLFISLTIVSGAACKKASTGPDEELVVTFPLWSGSYIDREAQYEHYGPWGPDDHALCRLNLLITKTDTTLPVKVSYDANIPGYLADSGTFTFSEVPGDSDTGLGKQLDVDGMRYKFSCSRNGTEPKKINLRYIEYKIYSDGSTSKRIKLDGIVK